MAEASAADKPAEIKNWLSDSKKLIVKWWSRPESNWNPGLRRPLYYPLYYETVKKVRREKCEVGKKVKVAVHFLLPTSYFLLIL